MRKIANIIIVMMVISFVLWGIININIINTASLSKSTDGVSSISQNDYKELKDEFGQDFLGLLEDDCEVKIHDEDGSYKLEFNGKYYNIDSIGSKLQSLGIIKEKGNWVFNKISNGVEYFYEKISNKISG
ncbi:hypothetical protein [Clostridium folliculivorans]|uniref:Uncharacterized protein n=1 Tax=Clostridium folliculivorans TaxID=2886038 RepID=A0A9W5XYZ8_9CLOT|nr:hypothetical protein [Clostridium folliculivorans]GKU23616.1 hypothetical protein CFOLD11_04420 [Clostridium folliculivorans]GKU29732.1 hypothetical protein CFB3_18390 [Clostridium folliculivorans]